MVTDRTFITQVLHGDVWIDHTTHDNLGEAVRRSDQMLENAEPGAYDGRLRIVERTVIDHTVLKVRGTVWI